MLNTNTKKSDMDNSSLFNEVRIKSYIGFGLIIFIFCIIMLNVANATNYYFSESQGNDSWSGLLAYPDGNGDGPKKTISAADAIIDGTLSPGDSLLFKRGDTWTQSANFISVSRNQGIQNNPIVIGAYGKGEKPIFNQTSSGKIILVRGSNDVNEVPKCIKFQDLQLITSGLPGNRPIGIFIYGSSNTYQPYQIIFDSIDVFGCQQGAVVYHNGHIFTNCYFAENFSIFPETGHSQGMYCAGDSVTFYNNHFENNGKEDSWFDWNMYISHGEGVRIENNVFNGHLSGIKLRSTTNVVVRGNTLYDLDGVGISIGGDLNNGSLNNLIENNLIYNSVDGITIKDQSGNGPIGIDSLIVRNNILHSNRNQTNPNFGNGYRGYIAITNNPINKVYIYNNLIYNIITKYAISSRNMTPRNCQIINNIFHKRDDIKNIIELQDTALSVLQLDANLYYCDSCDFFNVDDQIYSNLSAFNTRYPELELLGQEGNPMFIDESNNDFHLTKNSTLVIDKGLSLIGLVDSDFDNNKRPLDVDTIEGARWDIGPYEFKPKEPVIISQTLSECEGFSISVNGNNYSLTGIYYDTLVGTDTILKTNLSIVNIDTQLLINGLTLTAAESGAQYQWLDCTTNMPILDETDQSIKINKTGSYALTITKNECVVTSSCIDIAKTGMNQLIQKDINIYPNPIIKNFTIDLGMKHDNVKVQIENVFGKIVATSTYNSISKIDYSIDAASGIYFITIVIDNDKSETFKIIKN